MLMVILRLDVVSVPQNPEPMSREWRTRFSCISNLVSNPAVRGKTNNQLVQGLVLHPPPTHGSVDKKKKNKLQINVWKASSVNTMVSKFQRLWELQLRKVQGDSSRNRSAAKAHPPFLPDVTRIY